METVVIEQLEVVIVVVFVIINVPILSLNVLSHSLTLLSLFGLDELGPHVGPYYMGAPKVAHPEHQTELVVPQGDDGVFREHQCLRPFVGL